MNVLQADEAFQQQARADEEHERERHFRNDQRIAKTIAPETAGRAAPTFLERFG